MFVLLALGGPLVLDGLGIDSLTIGMPDTITFLFSFSLTPTEISMSVGPTVLAICAVIGMVYAFLQSYRRTKAPANETADNA